MKKLSFAVAALLLCVSVRADKYTSFSAQGLPAGTSKGVMLFVDEGGRISRGDLHGIKLERAIMLIALVADLAVEIESCPDELIAIMIRDDEPIMALRRLVKNNNLEMTEAGDGRYKIRIKAEPKTSD
jgi:hypothetical protein